MLRSFLIPALAMTLTAACSSSAGRDAAGADGGGATSADGAVVTQELDIDEGTFTVQPGQEVVYCVRIPMPAKFQGVDLALAGWDSDVSAPAHHYFMFFDTAPTSGSQPVPCQGTDPLIPVKNAGLNLFSTGALLFVTGTGLESYRGDPNYGTVLKANGTFVTNHHVMNAGSQPLTLHGQFKLLVSKATDVPHATRGLNCQSTDISLAPNSTQDVTATCLAPFDLDVVTMSSHSHQRLVKFETRFFDGQQTQPDVLYSSTQWDSPVIQHLTSPLHLKAGQGITFTCHFMNTTSMQIGFGFDANSEMCAAMNGYAYPSDHTYAVPPMLGATIFSNATPSTVADTTNSPIPIF